MSAPRDEAAGARELYLHLLKRALAYLLWDEVVLPVEPEALAGEERELAARAAARGMVLARRGAASLEAHREGTSHRLPLAHTMIGLPRLDDLQRCVETALREGVPGDLAETGIWRGGAAILMRGVLAAHGVTDRRIWAADSFRGLPAPDARYPADAGSEAHTWRHLAVSRAQVEATFARYGLLDDRTVFLEGWFEDTLPAAPIERLAVLRLDGDLYASTWQALVHLYPKLSPGGFLIVDDYGAVPACRQAVDEYRRHAGIVEPIEAIDWTGVYWRRTR